VKQPPKPYPRAARVRALVMHVLAAEVERMRDELGFVTVTDVSLSPDLRHAKAFYTILETGKEHDDVRAALTAVRARLRTAVAKQVRLKFAPTLELIEDPVPERARRLDEIIEKIRDDDR